MKRETDNTEKYFRNHSKRKSMSNVWSDTKHWFSDRILSHINECIVWSQWSDVEAGAARLSARLNHRQAAPGTHTSLNYTVNRSIPSRWEPQLFHDSGFLRGERRAPPCGRERGVHQLAHFLPGSRRVRRLTHQSAPWAVLRAAGQLLHAADACWFTFRGHNWKTHTRLECYYSEPFECRHRHPDSSEGKIDYQRNEMSDPLYISEIPFLICNKLNWKEPVCLVKINLLT